MLVSVYPIINAQSATQNSSFLDSLSAQPGVTIIQPEALTKRINGSSATQQANTKTDPSQPGAAQTEGAAKRGAVKGGAFRVEFYADNSQTAKQTATARRRAVQNRFPNYPTWLVFDSPFWRVKVGSFANRADAEAAVSELKRAFPSYAPYIHVVRH